MSIRSLSQQSDLFQRAAAEASDALSKWLGRPSKITINNVSVLPITEAVGVLGIADKPLAACAMQISGQYSGLLVLTSDDASGLALADILLSREIGSSTEWTEVEQSAAVETANIIGCAYLNAMASGSEDDHSAAPPLMPSPPWFVRDYAASVMQSIFMSQAALSDNVFLSHTDFSVDGMPGKCSLLFIPQADVPC
jgi:chemotaxis protein CheC